MGDGKRAHADLFGELVERADEFSSVETYTEALRQDAWQLAERLVKQSYKNGVMKGQASRSRRSAGKRR